ncbi:uncharacterized protein LOC144119254 [Amblyomma americanum]
MFRKIATFLFVQALLALAEGLYYPELRGDLQAYQEHSRCYPDVGEWYQIYRNYYYDPDFGGASKCVKYQSYGTYENFSTPAFFTYGITGNGSVPGRYSLSSTPCYNGKNLGTFIPDETSAVVQEEWNVIYTDCNKCFVARHRYAYNGYGCTYWRRVSTFHENGDCCDFIYDENCGSSPRYQIYYPWCAPDLGMPGA